VISHWGSRDRQAPGRSRKVRRNPRSVGDQDSFCVFKPPKKLVLSRKAARDVLRHSPLAEAISRASRKGGCSSIRGSHSHHHGIPYRSFVATGLIQPAGCISLAVCVEAPGLQAKCSAARKMGEALGKVGGACVDAQSYSLTVRARSSGAQARVAAAFGRRFCAIPEGGTPISASRASTHDVTKLQQVFLHACPVMQIRVPQSEDLIGCGTMVECAVVTQR